MEGLGVERVCEGGCARVCEGDRVRAWARVRESGRERRVARGWGI